MKINVTGHWWPAARQKVSIPHISYFSPGNLNFRSYFHPGVTYMSFGKFVIVINRIELMSS